MTNQSRLPFFDNIRTLMVILVLIFHSGASYGSAVKFWPFHDVNPSVFIDLFMLLGDVFMMATLFFIAGYFALPSLLNKGSGGFIISKLRRLGIPWFIGFVFALPVLDYINYATLSGGSRGFGEHWLLSLRKIIEFNVGWIDMSGYKTMAESIYQRYLWFVSLLLVFFLLFALGRPVFMRIKPDAGKKANIEQASRKKVFVALVIGLVVNIIIFGLVRFLAYPEFMGSGWFSLGNVVQFQLGKLTSFAILFGLGVIAYHRKWFEIKNVFGKPWIWLIVVFCAFGMNMLVMKDLSTATDPGLIHRLAFVALYPIWIFSFVGMFIAFGHKRWNRQTKANRSLAVNSYNMYLVHYIVPFTLPLALRHLDIPTLTKFLIVSLTTLVFSYAFSRFALKPFPKSTGVGIVVVVILISILI